jgi:hypothetical protein
MSKRKETYLGTNAMRATAHSLSLASSVLGFEIVELWSDEGNGKLHCTYVYCDDDVIKKYPNIIVGHHPNHKREHKLSPKVFVFHLCIDVKFVYCFVFLVVRTCKKIRV